MRLIGVVSTLVLVRILSPVDFGIVALAQVVAATLDQLTATGFNMAIIRMRAPQAAHYDTAWHLLIAVAEGKIGCHRNVWPAKLLSNRSATWRPSSVEQSSTTIIFATVPAASRRSLKRLSPIDRLNEDPGYGLPQLVQAEPLAEQLLCAYGEPVSEHGIVDQPRARTGESSGIVGDE